MSLGELYTNDTNANDDDTDDNTTQWTEHDCIGSLPNEPKTKGNFTQVHYVMMMEVVHLSKEGMINCGGKL